MDVLADFLADRCEVSDGLQQTNTPMYAAYKSWAMDNGQKPRSHKWLTRKLIDRGFKQGANREGGRVWLGITLTEEARGTQGGMYDDRPQWHNG